MVVVYLFQRGGWEGRQDALAPIRARGDKAEGGRSLFSLSDTLLFRFLTRIVCLSFHGRKREKAELPARSCPILPDYNNLTKQEKHGGHGRKSDNSVE